MVLLNVCELLRSSITDELSAASLEQCDQSVKSVRHVTVSES